VRTTVLKTHSSRFSKVRVEERDFIDFFFRFAIAVLLQAVVATQVVSACVFEWG
jgi:hypothetical protein